MKKFTSFSRKARQVLGVLTFGALASMAAAVAPVQAAENGVMMQYFQWYTPGGGQLWPQVKTEAPKLAAAGITALWLPPAYKGTSANDVGYGPYDLYDLGEFNQKGTIATKYGTKQQYLDAINAAHAVGIQIYGDVVFNHKAGADATENATAVRVARDNRNYEYGGNVNIDAWTLFNFPGRGNTYSSFKWHWYHFDGVDWAQNLKEGSIFKFRGTGKAWDWEVDSENGNYDYLMYADLDMDHPDVVAELKNWGLWYLNATGVDGFRIDAVKHIKYSFFTDWLGYLRTTTGKPIFAVGEFWSYDVGKLHNYITKSSGALSLFDAPLHMNFYNASNGGGYYDMRTILDNTLMKTQPALAVTLVDNHDTQPCQALASPVKDWFKPLAYAVILLRAEGYPTIFYPDYYGAQYTDCGSINIISQKAIIDVLLDARKNYAYGTQYNYLDNADIIGWTRLGNAQHPQTLAVILSDGPAGSKWMETKKANATYYDKTGNFATAVVTNQYGWGEFPVKGGSVSVWVEQASTGGGGTGGGTGTTGVTFTCNNGTTVWGQNVFAVGSIAALGNWNTNSAVQLSPTSYPSWTGTVQVPNGQSVEWKCIKKDGSANIQWQPGANNIYSGSGTSTTGSF